jgi:hypothetical protein
MAVHSRKDPDPKHPGADLTALAAVGDVAMKASRAFEEHLARVQCNPDLRTLVLTALAPIDTDQSGHTCLSIGVLNPTAVDIYWGIGGARPQPGQRAIAQPGKSLMVLPLRASDFSIGADPADLAAGDVPVFLLRFSTVQACFLGSVA